MATRSSHGIISSTRAVVRWLNHKRSSCANANDIRVIKAVCGHCNSTFATIRDAASVARYCRTDTTALLMRELDSYGSFEIRLVPLMVEVTDMWLHLRGRRHHVNTKQRKDVGVIKTIKIAGDT